MKKIIIFLSCLILLTACAKETDYSEDYNRPQIIEEVVKTEMEIGFFYGGLALVHDGENYGYMDESGELAIPLIYKDASRFSQGYAAVKKDGKYGLIDKTGAEVIPFIYDSSFSVSGGVAAVEIGDGEYILINVNGSILTDKPYEAIELTGRSNFRQSGLIPVMENGKWGFISIEGDEVIPPVYDEAEGFYGGLSATVLNGMTGYINNKNETVIPHIYTKNSQYNRVLNDRIIVTDMDGRMGVTDTKNNIIIPIEYEAIEHNFDNLFYCSKKNKTTIYNSNGAVMKNIRTGNGILSYADEGMFILEDGDISQILNFNGKKISRIKFDTCDSFSNGLISVSANGKYGYMNRAGAMVIPLEFTFAGRFNNGCAIVEKDGTAGVINVGGEYLIPMDEQEIRGYSDQFIISKNGENTIVKINFAE